MFLSIVGFAFGAFNPGMFGLKSAQWLLGGLYGASLGGSLWSATHKPKQDGGSNTYNFDQLQNQLDSNNRIPLIYGTRKWAGQQTYHLTSSDKQYVTEDIVWCEGEIDGIYDIRANDIYIGNNILIYINNTKYSDAKVYIGSDSNLRTILNLYANGVTRQFCISVFSISTHSRGLKNGDAVRLINQYSNEGWVAKTDVPNEKFSNTFFSQNCYNNPYVTYTPALSGCSYSFSSGSPTQSPPDNYTTVGGYKNVAWSRFSLKASEQLSGKPTLTAIIRGKKVWDTRTNTYTYSSNPAMCVRDYLLSKRYGAGHFIYTDVLDEDSFREVADYCDQLVTTRVPTLLATYDDVQAKITELQRYLNEHSSSLSQAEQDKINNEIVSLQQSLTTIQSNPVEYTLEVTPRYSLNIIITETKSHIEILQDMFAVFGGFLVFSNNKVSLRCEKATPVSYHFTDDTIIEHSLDHTQYPIDQSPNSYNVKFYDPDNEWTGVKVLVEDTVDQSPYPIGRGKIINKDVDLIGCTSQSQALRLARLYRDKIKLCSIVIQFQTATMAMHLEPGDVITVSKKMYPNGIEQWLFKDMPFRILEISEQNGIYSIKAEQYNESIYNDALGAQIQVNDYVQIPNPFSDTVPDVTNISLSQIYYKQKDGTIVSDIILNYTLPNYHFLRQVVIGYSIDDGISWYNAGNTTDSQFILHNAIVDKRYIFKLVNENSVGRKSSGTISDAIIVTGKDILPSDVLNLVATINTVDTTKIDLAWNKCTDVDFNRYSIRYGTNWDTGTIISDNVFDNRYTFTPSTSGTYNIMVKSVDNSGGYSANPANYSIDIVLEPNQVANFGKQTVETDRSQVLLSWSPNTENNISHYELRIGNEWDTAIIIASQLKATQFIYRVATEGHTTFLIKAVNTKGYYSVNVASADLQIILRPDTPTNLQATQEPRDRSMVKVTWGSSPGKDIAGYELRYGTSWDTGMIINTVTDCQYWWYIPASGTYNIMVKAKTVAGHYSNVANTTISAAVEPYDVTGFVATQSISDRTKVTLSWDTPISLDVSYFIIKKGTNWDTGTIIGQRVTGTFYDVIVKEETPQTFWVKAASVAGHQSQNPSRAEGIFNMNPSPISDIQIRQNPNDKSILNIMWKGVSESDLSGYQVKIGQVWESADALPLTQELYCTYNLKQTGDIKVMIKTINAAGFYSDEVSANYYATVEPLDVTGFQVLQNGEYIEFFWDKHPENDVVAFEIREGANFELGTLVASGITLNSYTVKVDVERNYRYHIKAINRSNRYSQQEVSQTVYVSNLPPKNIILEYDEIVRKDGTHNNTEFGISLINWSNLGGRFSNYPTTKFSDVGGQTVLKLRNANIIKDGNFSSGLLDSQWKSATSGTLTLTAGVLRFTSSAASNNGIYYNFPETLDRNGQYVVEFEARASKSMNLTGGFTGENWAYANSNTNVTAQAQNLTASWQIFRREYIINTSGTDPGMYLFNYGNYAIGDWTEIKWARIYKKTDEGLFLVGQRGGGYYQTGDYSAGRIDVGQVITANVSIQFVSSVILRGSGSAKLQIRTSRDGTTWAEWQDFKPAQYTFRYLDQRVLLATDDPTKTPEVNQFITRIDVDDTIQVGTVDVPTGGISVLYAKQFYTLPVTTGTAIGSNRFPEITNETKSGHMIKIVDRTGADVGGKYNYSSKGY